MSAGKGGKLVTTFCLLGNWGFTPGAPIGCPPVWLKGCPNGLVLPVIPIWNKKSQHQLFEQQHIKGSQKCSPWPREAKCYFLWKLHINYKLKVHSQCSVRIMNRATSSKSYTLRQKTNKAVLDSYNCLLLLNATQEPVIPILTLSHTPQQNPPESLTKGELLQLNLNCSLRKQSLSVSLVRLKLIFY